VEAEHENSHYHNLFNYNQARAELTCKSGLQATIKGKMTTCIFPLRSQITGDTSEDRCSNGDIVDVQLPSKHSLLHFCKTHYLAMEQMIHAAWALVLRRYIGSDVIAFAILTSPVTADCATVFTCLMEEQRPFSSYLETIKNYYCSSSGSLFQGSPAVAVNTGVHYHGVDEQRQALVDTSAVNIPRQVSGS
jgi:hypothetical protein